MTVWKWLPCLVIVGMVIHLVFAADDAPQPRVELRADDNSVWISADEIVSYTWETHTLSLKPGVRDELAKRLLATKRLVNGVPFSVVVDGQPLYKGRFTSILSSASQDAVVIVIDQQQLDRALRKDQLRIDLGYPGGKFFTGTDPRTDPRLHQALVKTGKLQHELSHVEWVAAALKDIETLKPGMTRAELLGLFEEEGGLATRRKQRFAYRQCPYIKVDATFEPVGEKDDTLSRDKLESLSKPFLEWPIAD